MKFLKLSVYLFLLSGVPAWAGDLRLGRAAVKITPPVGVPMGGYFYLRPSTSVHDGPYVSLELNPANPPLLSRLCIAHE
jgi:hypothetical protein